MFNHAVMYGSLEELYNDNRKLVFIMVSDYTDDEEQKKDINSSVWAKIAEQPQKYMTMEPAHFKNYLRMIVKASAVDYLKCEEKEASKLQNFKREERISYCDFKEGDFYADYLEYLAKAVSVLNFEEKELLRMRFGMKLPARQVGELLGVSEVNVRVRQKRILAKLKKEILKLMKRDDRI